MTRVNGRVAVVTGAAFGIGRGCAIRLAREGATVALVDRDAGALASVKQEVESCGARALCIQADCLKPSAAADALRKIEREVGPIDILFNNVGQSTREKAGPFLSSDETTWQFMIDINLYTTMRFSRVAGTGMCERGWGRIVNVASDTAFVGDVGYADYAAAKMAVIGFTRALAREVAPKGVTVNAICPGPVRTRALEANKEAIDRSKAMIPSGIVGEVEDIAGVVVLLASEEGRYITGQSILVDGGRWMI